MRRERCLDLFIVPLLSGCCRIFCPSSPHPLFISYRYFIRTSAELTLASLHDFPYILPLTLPPRPPHYLPPPHPPARNSPQLTTTKRLLDRPPRHQPHHLRLRHLLARSPLPAPGRAGRLEFHAAGARCRGRGAGAGQGGSVLWRAVGGDAGAGAGVVAAEELEDEDELGEVCEEGVRGAEVAG